MALDRYASARRAAKRCEDWAKRLRDPRAALTVIAAHIEQVTRDSFHQSRSPAGQRFDPLKLSTLLARGPGQSTKPLVRSGEALASVRCVVVGMNTLSLRAAGYLGFHVRGSSKLAKRNPFPFELGHGGRMRPIPKLYKLMSTVLRAHVLNERRANSDVPLAAE
jgi:hypothetical protein